METEQSKHDLDHGRQQEQLERARAKARQTIKSRLSSSRILGDADLKVYEEAMSDKALADVNKVRHEDKLKYIQNDIERSMVDWLVKEASTLESQFRDGIAKARGKWISASKADWWIAQLENKSIPFHKKHLFIAKKAEQEGMTGEKSFAAFVNNWKFVAESAATIRKDKASVLAQLTSMDVSDIDSFRSAQKFIELPWKKRKALLETVDAAVKAKEKRMPHLYAQAKAMLDQAVHDKALSPNKIGTWLQRIFSSGAKAELIEQFINGSGASIDGKKMTLTRLIANWSEASTHFRVIENKRLQKGTPRGFHFVKMDVFLNWDYVKRTSYLQEAEHRFVDINKEPEIFMKIRHEIGAKDWEAAEDLIDDANREPWGFENQRKLRSMELFIKFHRHGQETKKAEQKPTDKEIISEMEFLMAQLPPQLRSTYRKALSKGYQAFWVLTTLMYNRVWCHQHNFLDTGKEKRIEKKAKDQTRERMHKGHQKYGLEANVLKGDTNSQPAVRDQSGIRGAQILYTEENSSETLVNEINEQKGDRSFWYWTSMIPEGIEYAEHLQIVHMLHPRMKKLARLMHDRGITATAGGHMTPQEKVAA